MVSSCAQPSKTSYQLASILEWQQRGIPMGKGWWAKISFRPAFNPSSSAHVADVVWRVPPGHVAEYPRTERKEYIALNGKNFPGFMLSRIGEVCTLLAKMLVDIFHRENYVQYLRRISRSSSMFLLLVREKWKKRDAEMANNCCEFLQETDEPSVQILLRGSVESGRETGNSSNEIEKWPGRYDPGRISVGRWMRSGLEQGIETGKRTWKNTRWSPIDWKVLVRVTMLFIFFFFSLSLSLVRRFVSPLSCRFRSVCVFFFLFLEKSSRAKVEIDRFEQFLILKYTIRGSNFWETIDFDEASFSRNVFISICFFSN